jgi:hypothetical protein
MVVVVVVPRRPINSRAMAHAATLVGIMIMEIVIMAIVVVVLLLVVVTVGVPEARLFADMGKAMHIPTFRVAGDLMVVARVLVLKKALRLPRASWPGPWVVGRR